MNKRTRNQRKLNLDVQDEVVGSLFDMLVTLDEAWHRLYILNLRMRLRELPFAMPRLAAMTSITRCLTRIDQGVSQRLLVELLENALQGVNKYADAVAKRYADMPAGARAYTEGKLVRELYGACSQALLALGILIEAVEKNRIRQ